MDRLVILIVSSATNPFEYGHKPYAIAPQLYQFIVVNCPEQIPYDLIWNCGKLRAKRDKV
jgi:hypothetical protein